jgi:hypothetical protein
MKVTVDFNEMSFRSHYDRPRTKRRVVFLTQSKMREAGAGTVRE